MLTGWIDWRALRCMPHIERRYTCLYMMLKLWSKSKLNTIFSRIQFSSSSFSLFKQLKISSIAYVDDIRMCLFHSFSLFFFLQFSKSFTFDISCLLLCVSTFMVQAALALSPSHIHMENGYWDKCSEWK